MSLYISCNIVYFIDSNSPHITFPFYPQIPFDGCTVLPVQPSPYSIVEDPKDKKRTALLSVFYMRNYDEKAVYRFTEVYCSAFVRS